MKKVWGSSHSLVQSEHEKMSKDVTNAAACKSGDFQVVSAGGEEVGADGGDGVGDSAGGEEVGADGRDGVGDSVGGEEVGTDGGDGVDESKVAAQTDAEGEDCVGESLGDAENDAVDGKKSNVKHGGDAPKTFEPLYRDTKSKNKRRPCAYCNFFGVHLNRHLQSVHGDIVTSKDLQMRLVYQADVKEKRKRGEKTTISNKHEHLYQCGLPDCHKIVSRMAQHLKRYHKIVNPAKIAEAQKKFTRLSGQRKRQPTSTQAAKPKPATKVRRGPKSPKSKKRAADNSSDIVPPTPK